LLRESYIYNRRGYKRGKMTRRAFAFYSVCLIHVHVPYRLVLQRLAGLTNWIEYLHVRFCSYSWCFAARLRVPRWLKDDFYFGLPLGLQGRQLIRYQKRHPSTRLQPHPPPLALISSRRPCVGFSTTIWPQVNQMLESTTTTCKNSYVVVLERERV
jgi:hypothetical protein